MAKKIALGADHAGFRLKEQIKHYLDKKKVGYIDLGAHGLNKADDYPDFAVEVARFVARKKTKGILVCGSGVGMAMAANKVKGIRAAAVYDVKMARLSRQHDDANVLCLAGRMTKPELAKRIVSVWLKEKFQGGRHRRRVEKIKRIK